MRTGADVTVMKRKNFFLSADFKRTGLMAFRFGFFQ